MSETVYWVVLGVALILAGYQVRRALVAWGKGHKTDAKVIALSALATAGLGILLGGWAVGWDSWPAGFVVGLAASAPLAEKWARKRLGGDDVR